MFQLLLKILSCPLTHMFSGYCFCELSFNILLFLKYLLKGQDRAISLKNSLNFTLNCNSHLIYSNFVAGSHLLHLESKLIENSSVLLNNMLDLNSFGSVKGIIQSNSFLNVCRVLVILAAELSIEIVVHVLNCFIKLSSHVLDIKAILIILDLDLLSNFAHFVSVSIQSSLQFLIGFFFVILHLSLHSSNCCFMSILSTIHLVFMSFLVSFS